ncbi:MAG: GuaB3 family IMP dehydrogenase-related protein [Candidatus Nanopelagicales bacterium]
MSDIEIGLSKRGRSALSFDDIAIAPSRRTRAPELVNVSWQVDAYRFDNPLIGAPMDSVSSPEVAIEMGRLGGLGVLCLDGLWTRYEDPSAAFAEIAELPELQTTARMQQLYSEPIKAELITQRIQQVRAAGVTVAASLSPNRVPEFADAVVKAGVDLFVIRGTTVSAEHVGRGGALNLKEFIYQLEVPVIVGGVATYRAALHLMRAGAAGVLVGFGGGATHTSYDVMGLRVPMATAVADVASARRDYLDESGGRYTQVIADGAMGRSGDIVKAIACGADAVMIGSPLARASEAPGRGWHWGMEAVHPELPRGERHWMGTVGSLEQIVHGPSCVADGTMNLIGALRRAMATSGYSDLKEFQRMELTVSPGR